MGRGILSESNNGIRRYGADLNSVHVTFDLMFDF